MIKNISTSNQKDLFVTVYTKRPRKVTFIPIPRRGVEYWTFEQLEYKLNLT